MRAHAFEFFSAREDEIERHLSRESRRFLAGAAAGHRPRVLGRAIGRRGYDDGRRRGEIRQRVRAAEGARVRGEPRIGPAISIQPRPMHPRPRDRPRAASRVRGPSARRPLCARHRHGRAGRAGAVASPGAGPLRAYVRQAGSGALARLPVRAGDGGCARVACVRMTATESSETVTRSDDAEHRALAITTRFLRADHSPSRCAAQAPQPTAAPTAKPEEGIPITDATVQKACGSCHKPDDKGQMSRISFQRNTPEGWQTIIQRMAALNGLSIEPATARAGREVPVEQSRARAGRSEAGRVGSRAAADRLQVHREQPTPKSTCNKCHSLGRVISQRRTQDRVGSADRHASRLVSARRQPGVPPRRPAAARRRRPTDVRRTIAIRSRRRSITWRRRSR